MQNKELKGHLKMFTMKKKVPLVTAFYLGVADLIKECTP